MPSCSRCSRRLETSARATLFSAASLHRTATAGAIRAPRVSEAHHFRHREMRGYQDDLGAGVADLFEDFLVVSAQVCFVVWHVVDEFDGDQIGVMGKDFFVEGGQPAIGGGGADTCVDGGDFGIAEARCNSAGKRWANISSGLDASPPAVALSPQVTMVRG